MKKNIIIIVLYILGQFLAVVPYLIIQLAKPGFIDPYQTTAFIVTYGTIFVLLIYFIFKELTKQFKPFFSRIYYNILIIIATFVSAIALSYVANVIMYLFGYTEEAENQGGLIDMIKHANQIELVALVLLFCLFVPIIEEMVFRKALYGLMKKLVHKILFIRIMDKEDHVINRITGISAVVISGLVFGLVHISGDYIYLLQYGVLGILIGSSYYLSKENIYVPLAIHIFQNTLATVQLLTLLSLGQL